MSDEESEGPPYTSFRFQVIFHRPGPLWSPGLDYLEQPGIGAHIAFMRSLTEQDLLVLGGPFLDGSGGMAIVRCSDVAEARRLAETDETVRDGLLGIEVVPWAVPMATIPLR